MKGVMEVLQMRAIQFIIGTIVVEFFVDVIISRIAPPKARYFVLHVIFNTWLSVNVWDDSIHALLNPSDAMLGDGGVGGYSDAAIITTAGITGFHVYHMLFFTGISAEDWIHHVVSCLIVPVIGIACPFGKIVSVSNLGMCGIPGAIDYSMLAAVKWGKLNPLTEKRINSQLNLLLRWPLMLLSAYMFVVGWANGTVARASQPGSEAWVRYCMALGVFLHSANAAYYAQKVIGNFHVKYNEQRASNNKKEK